MKIKKNRLIISVVVLLVALVGGLSTLFFDKSYSAPDLSNLQLTMHYYDSRGDYSQIKTEDIVWSRNTSSDDGRIKIQVNYKLTGITENIPAGALQFKVYGLESVGGEVISISADSKESGKNDYIFNYTHNEGSYNSTKKIIDDDYYTFSNNNELDTSHFEGSIQIEYRMYTGVINGGNTKIKLIRNDNLVSDINISTSTKKTPYSVLKYAGKINDISVFDNANNYIWVRYNLDSSYNSSNGVRMADPRRFIEKFESDIVVYDKNNKKLTPASSSGGIDTYYINDVWATQIYINVGYPKSIYQDRTVSNTVLLEGKYCEGGSICPYTIGEYEQLATSTINVNLSEFEFVYTGDKYAIYKTCSGTGSSDDVSYYSIINNTGNTMGCKTTVYAKHLNPVKLRVYDDVLYITDKNSNYRKLNDDEYHFKEINFYGLQTINGDAVPANTYDMKVYVRHRGSNNYVYHGSKKNGRKNSGNLYTIEENDIVSFYVEIENLTHSLNNGTTFFDSEIEFHTSGENILEEGTIHNFVNLQVYDSNNNLLNQVGLDSYNSLVTKDLIAPYDMQTYGHYVQRSTSKINYYKDTYTPSVTKFANISEYDSSNNSNIIDNNIYTGFGSNTTTYGSITRIGIYDLLPLGAKFDDDIERIKTTMYTRYEWLYPKKEQYKSNEEFMDYVKDNITLSVKDNWNNTGRTRVAFEIDFSKRPLLLKDRKTDAFATTYEIIGLHFNSRMYDIDILEYGSEYSNTAYLTFDVSEPEKVLISPNTNNPEESLDIYDMDNNGDTTHWIEQRSAKLYFPYTVESHQDVQTLVQTYQNNFTIEDVKTSLNTDYEYKLRVRTANNRITNFILYDNLEEAYEENPHWKGEFQGIDTTYAEKQGYKIKVYYSEKTDAKKLSNDSSWKEYNDSVDKTKVKSLAFEYLDASGKPAVVPANSVTYVIVKMKSPKEISADYAYNKNFVEWNALGSNDEIIDRVEGLYSNLVRVQIEDYVPPTTTTTKEVKGTTQKIDNPKTGVKTLTVIIIFLAFVTATVIAYQIKGKSIFNKI